jgi:hypothetical protein
MVLNVLKEIGTLVLRPIHGHHGHTALVFDPNQYGLIPE